jgi:hypothetical protein
MRRILIGLGMIIFCSSLFAQQTNGRIIGTVVDDEGNPLPGVAVNATSPKLVGNAAANTDSNGSYRLFSLVPGEYKLVFSLSAFQTLTREKVVVGLEQTITLNVTMQLGKIENEIIVVGQAPLIDTKSTVKGMTLTKEIFQSLPKARSADSLITAIPGVSNEPYLGGTSVDGASGLENMYYADGVNITNLTKGNLGQAVNFDFVEEIQVKASGYAAEFGGSLGGVVNVVTSSGGNEFHGSVLGYYNGWNARGERRDLLRLDLTDSTKAAYYPYTFFNGVDKDHQFEFGGSLGGYVVRDKLWFFASFLPVLYDNTRTVTYFDGTVAPWKRNETSLNFAAKLSSQPFKNLRVSASVVNNFYKYQGDLSTTQGNSHPETSYDDYGYSYPNLSGNVTADLIASNHLLVGVRAGYFMYNQNNQLVKPPAMPCYQFLVPQSGAQVTNIGLLDVPTAYQHPVGWSNFSSSNANELKNNLDERFSVEADVNYFFNLAGEHSFKVGGQFVRQGENRDQSTNYPVIMLGWGSHLLAFGKDYGTGTYGVYGVRGNALTGPYGYYYKAYSNRWAFYIQDSWTVMKKLTLNLGLRAESEYVPSYATGNPEFENLKPIVFNFGDKMAPRFGFIYDVFGDSSLKVFGSLGWFYDVMKLNLAADIFGGYKTQIAFYSLDTYEFDKIGVNDYFPGRLLYTDAQNGVLNMRIPDFSVIGSGLKPMSQREISFGAEKKLRDDLSASFRVVNKHLLWAIEDMGIKQPEGMRWYTGNPGGDFINGKYQIARDNGLIPSNAWNSPKAKREYWAVNLSLEKRFSNNWVGGFSYTWSRLTGSYSGLASGDEWGRQNPNTEHCFDQWYLMRDITGKPLDGPLPGDRPHYFKLYGSYIFPFGLTVGTVVNAMSGMPVSTVWNAIVAGLRPFNRMDLGRTPFLWFTNLYVEYGIKIGGSRRLSVNLNIDNLFNIATAQRIYEIYNQGNAAVPEARLTQGSWDINDYNPKLDPRYKMPMDFYDPINARIGFKFAF